MSDYASVMADGVPRIVTSRWSVEDGHTLDGYRRSGSYEGYAAIRQALNSTPAEVLTTVKDAVVLGRGGAGFPAGTKWGFLPPDVYPRYIVVNGDESEPGTYKDRVLMERDPHQLIEGCLIAAYAVGAAQVFLYVRGEMAHRPGTVGRRAERGLRRRLRRQEHPRHRLSVDIVLHWGAGAYIVGEETALIESLEGNRGMPRLKPPFFPPLRASI
jgi:NADH-quinone oxidoreductase subunit F